jgi:hypothetical protein
MPTEGKHAMPCNIFVIGATGTLVRSGKCEIVDQNVERLTGKPATNFDEFVKRNISAWQ